MATIAYLQLIVKVNSRMFPRKRRRSAITVSSRSNCRKNHSAKDRSRPDIPHAAQFVAILNVAVHSVGKLDAELCRELLHARVVIQKFCVRPRRHLPGEPRDLLFFGDLQPLYRLVRIPQPTVN